MTLALALAAQILHITLMLAAAPVLAGITDSLDARLAGRTGPPLAAPWRDLVRLSRKTATITDSASIVSRVAPPLALGATLAVAALVPSFTLGMALSPLADTLIIVSLLTLARIATGLAALDSGTALAGLTQQTASALAVLAEPALMLVVVALALMGGSFNLDLIIGQQREGVLLPAAASAVALTALLALLFADLAATGHDTGDSFSGLDLAMLQVTAWLRRLIWIDLIGALFLPIGLATAATAGPAAWLTGLAAWAIKLCAAALTLSAVHILLGRVPRHSLPDLIGIAALLAVLAVIMVLASTGLT